MIPSLIDLNRYVVRKHADDWKDIGIELGFDFVELQCIERDHPQESAICFQNTLVKWLQSNPDVTWKTLEVALTNVNRVKLGLNPVDGVYGKEMYYIRC